MIPIHEKYMRVALREAQKARVRGEVPVGAVLVKNNRIIAKGYNKNIACHDPVAHAEILVLQKAGKKLKNYRLAGCTLYVTLEPCAMCACAVVHARIKKLIFGAKDPKTGACGSVFNITNSKKLNHSVTVLGGILQHDCSAVIKDFFRKKRNK